MKKEFYSVMGWDEQGRPTSAKLAELGISSIEVPIGMINNSNECLK
jgi:aldehyde:ferredoxin oxidoreductase